jgi:hypothetical protein
MTMTPETIDAAPPSEHADSLAAMLRLKRQRQAAARTRVFELPGYGLCLGARLRTAEERDVIADAAVMLGNAEVSDDDAAEMFNARRVTIARACVEVVARNTPDEAWTPISKLLDDGLGPVRFDQRLVEFLGGSTTDAASATDAVKFVVDKALPFLGLYGLYAEWCAIDEPLDDDELVGESSAVS